MRVWKLLVTVLFLILAAATAPRLRAQGPPPTVPPPAAVDLEGTLEVQYVDSTRGAELLHFLHTGSQRLRLVFADGPPGLLSGTRIRARGLLQNGTLTLANRQSSQVIAAAPASTTGVQRTIVILVNFQDYSVVPYSWNEAYTTTFQTTSDFYLENTFGQTSLAGDLYGWYTIPMSSSSCDYSRIGSLAEQAASSHGANISQYPRRVYAFPQIGACAWWGLGTVGGNPSQAWINGSYALKVVAHELGHNLGAYHSHSQPCDLSGCGMIEYGDDRDVMGNPTSGHFNAFQKERFGWLNGGSSLQTVTASGTYSIDAFETVSAGPKALKLLKQQDQFGGKTWYYLEARTDAGFDNGIGPGVIVHTGSDSSGDSSYEFDLDTAGGGFDPVLDVGQTFTDPVAGLTITAVSAGAAVASINIVYSGPSCVARPPAVALSPTATQVTSPTFAVSYSVAVTNTDDAVCAPSQFGLSANAPAGWAVSFDQSSVTLASGATGSAVLSLTPPAGSSGLGGFTVDATRSSGPGGSTSGSVFVATALDVSLSISSSNPYQFTATVLAGPAAVSGAPVTFTMRDPQGNLKATLVATTNANGVATSTKLRLKPRDPRGTYQVQATTTARGLNGSATGSFQY